MSIPSPKIKLPSLNGHLICGLCGGYLIDATVLTECIHVFCRSCILKYLTEHKVCPLCQSLIQETRPGQALRPDVALQRVVYKLVPGLLRTEMQRLMDFYSSDTYTVEDDGKSLVPQSSEKNASPPSIRLDLKSDFCQTPLPTALATRSLSKLPQGLPVSPPLCGPIPPINKVPSSFAFLISETEYLSISLTPLDYAFEHDPIVPSKPNKSSHSDLPTSLNSTISPKSTNSTDRSPSTAIYSSSAENSIHLLCPAVVTVGTLHHLLLAKYQLDPVRQVVDIYLGDECLEPSHSLREVAFLYSFPARKQRMCLVFAFTEACFAWWGRPMPRLERPRQKYPLPNGWSHSRHRRTSSSPEQAPQNYRHHRARSKSGEHYRLVESNQPSEKHSSL